ncbi:MAG: BTAD domain-containing putative transcriptional regulator [Chloroflexota bacterium]
MPHLSLSCFQSFAATLNQESVSFRSVRGRALLVYLAVEQTVPHQRSTVAGLLWPDVSESRARKNLTQTLLEVRKAIGNDQATPPFLEITSRAISFNPDSSHQLDVAEFRRTLKTEDLASAVAHYKGPFLDGFFVPESDLFEAWMQATREQLHQQVCDALRGLSAEQEAQGQLDQAIESVRRLLELAPYQEEAHYQLMRLLARNGQRSMALAQYDALTQMLMDELGVPPAAETDTLYDQILAGEIESVESQTSHGVTSTSSASLAETSPPIEVPFQALAASPHFVGRQAEIAQLRGQIKAPGLQIHAIVGMGGAGKTALATHFAYMVRNDFSDGVLWGNPAISAPLDILATWAAAYGYDFSQMSDIESRAAAVRGVLAKKQALIVIDNVELSGDVESLLPNSESCAVLLSTRDLDVATALNAETLLLGELDKSEALELLEEILGEERVERELDAAVELCTLCGELPLAVEIAAQRLKSRPRMKLNQMVARLSDQQKRLDLGISDRAVRASFEVSWEALDEELQQVFPLLAVFEGRSFRAEAMAYLAQEALFDIEDLLYAWSALSLVRPEEEERWQQHPLLADFAGEKLTDSQGAYARFADCFFKFARENGENFDQLEPEWENISAGMKVAYEQKLWPLTLAYADVLQRPWFTRARYSDARRGFGWAYEAADKIGDEAESAKYSLYWGEACLEQNDYEEARLHLNNSLSYCRNSKNAEGVAQIQDHLARIAIEVNEYEMAAILLDENLEIYATVENQAGVASVYFQKARIDYANTEWGKAQQSAEMAFELQSNLDDTLGLIRTSRLLAQIYCGKEVYEQALTYGLQSQRLSEQCQDMSELAVTLYTVSVIRRKRHEYRLALGAAEQSLDLLHQMGNQRGKGLILAQLSEIQSTMGNIEEAQRFAMQSLEIARSLNNRISIGYALMRLHTLYIQQGAQPLITQTLDEIRTITEELDHVLLKNYVQEHN